MKKANERNGLAGAQSTSRNGRNYRGTEYRASSWTAAQREVLRAELDKPGALAPGQTKLGWFHDLARRVQSDSKSLLRGYTAKAMRDQAFMLAADKSGAWCGSSSPAAAAVQDSAPQ